MRAIPLPLWNTTRSPQYRTHCCERQGGVAVEVGPPVLAHHAGSATHGLPAERPEKGPDIGGQRLRLLQGGKVAPTVYGRPALDVEHALGH